MLTQAGRAFFLALGTSPKAGVEVIGLLRGSTGRLLEVV
ncbi:hypothetical protein BN128_4603 [Cronobacter sakazakii 696]|nr:hypothetical protein BN128_4603 [Cronobacter sakazakii 696]